MAAPILQFKRGVFANLPGLRAGEPGFTTDSYDLYVGINSTTQENKFFGSHRYWNRETTSTGSGLNLVEGTSNGSDFITLKSPNTLAGIVTYTFPASPVENNILTTDANGVLSWSSPAAPVFAGIYTFTDATDNTLGDENTGSVQLDGGMGIAKNLTVKQNLHVGGYAEFVGVVTFKGGTINIGDENTDNINVGGEFISGLAPSVDNTYDIGISTQRWKDAYFSGIGSFATGAVIDGIQIGINGANVIDTVSGNLTFNSAGGQTIIDDQVTIQNNLTVNGNVTIGGTTVSLRGTDVFIENKDIVLGFTTTITPNDDTANHAGVAIASTEGTPLVNFDVSGINTLPSTYKQMMWFKSGTLGFSTDAFAFNYGVAIGTTTMASGVRLAVGSSVTITDTTVTATTGSFTNLAGTLTGTISTATRATTLDTTTAATGTYYPALLTSSTGTTSAVVNVDSGISYVSDTDTLALTGDIAVNGGDVTTSATTATVFNTNATTVNFAGAATALVMGAATGITTVSNNLTVGGDIRVNGNDIQASDGNANITLTSNTLTTFAGDIKVTGNDIQASDGNTNITLTSNTLTTFAGDIKVTGNDIQASDGNTNITMTSNTLTEVKGDLKITGKDIQSSTGTVAITLADNDVTVADDLTVEGNLYVKGNTTQVNTASLTVEDRTIDLGIVNGAAPATNTTWDLGILFNYMTSSTAKKSAVIWEHADTRFKFASLLSADTDGSTVDTPQLTVTTFAPIEIGQLWVTDCAGTSQVISCTGTTRNLENITIDAGTFV